MRFLGAFALWMMLGAANVAHAQEVASGWLGAELADITKDDATTLGWETPHGAKVLSITPGSPAADKLQAGDVIESVDKLSIDGKTDFDTAIAGMPAGTTIKLRLQRDGKGKTVSITLAAHSADAKAAVDAPIPMLDIGGHMAMINDIAFTPDGRQIVSASDDKTIRVWDVATAKTARIIRGEVAPGSTGKIYAIALSKDGKWLAVGGMFHQSDPKAGAVIRLYDFATGRLAALLKGHQNVVDGLAFSPDGQHLISGSKDFSAIIWDVATAKALHHLEGHRAGLYTVAFTPDGERAVTASDQQFSF